MAKSGLDHLKNGYRRRFCRPFRVPDINTGQGKNMLEILQDCFEEKSLTNDFSINSTKSVRYSTPRVKDNSIHSSSKEKSHSKSVPVSSRKKEAPLQDIIEPNETAHKSVQGHEVLQKILATDIVSRNTPDLKKKSSKKPSDHPSEAEEEFYLSVGSPAVLLDAKTSVSQNTSSSLAQKRETYTFGNSLNMLSSSTEISLKTKKRLNFEDKDIFKKVEIENKVSEVENKIPEGQQERKPSETFQKSVQDLEHEIQPQTKKSFSTLFLETVRRKSEFSPIVKHIVTAPPHSSSPNDMKLLEDEFVIDESDKSFASGSWITIPRKGGSLKQPTISPDESTAVLQGKKSREKHRSVSPNTLRSDQHLHKAHPEQKFQPCDEKKVDTSSSLTDELENNDRSTKYEISSENVKKPSENKRPIKQNQRRKFKANVVKEQLDLEQSKDKNVNMSHSAEDKLQKNLHRNGEDCEGTRNDNIFKTPTLPVGDKKINRGTKNNKEESRKKHFSSESKKNKLVPEEVTITVMRSHRLSRRPSDWWVVKSDESPVHSNSSIKNELSVYHNPRQKSAKKTNQSSKNTGKKAIPLKKQKTAMQGSSRVQKFLNVKGSEYISNHEKLPSCSQNEPSESDKADLAAKKSLDCSGTTERSKDQCGVTTAQNVRLKSQTSDHICKTPTESNLDSGKCKTSVLEESGPSRIKNYLMFGKNTSDVCDEEVQERLDDSRLKRTKVSPEKKTHHKLILPSNTPNVRRTKRIRFKPLEYWRGERIDYQETSSGEFVIGGILSPVTITSKRKAKGNVERVKKVTNRKRMCLDNDERKNKLILNVDISLRDPLQPTPVKDPETREIVLMDLIKPQDTYQFFVEHGGLKVYKTLDTPLFSTGKLILGPYEEKGKQHVSQDILIFYVHFGDLLCTLCESSYLITTGDSFYVPSGNYYNIKNLLNDESVLLFTQIKR
ncbi:centromere protein C [Ictidomys tridecemlineatus]|uniref:Centromere protein C n=1 Tax=Ictidomys tridecemlineatus TaxID=43179 RepID=I3MHY1_ICTTR|nr:centromere protein C [Ictidomys tridecemlineatus]KAG3276543.1 centromere protein C [Ictidomys tridecemlineatus]